MADVAQLVEQSIRNRQVIGSSPIVGSIYFCRFAPPASIPAPSELRLAPDAAGSARGRPRPLLFEPGLTNGVSFPQFSAGWPLQLWLQVSHNVLYL